MHILGSTTDAVTEVDMWFRVHTSATATAPAVLQKISIDYA